MLFKNSRQVFQYAVEKLFVALGTSHLFFIERSQQKHGGSCIRLGGKFKHYQILGLGIISKGLKSVLMISMAKVK